MNGQAFFESTTFGRLLAAGPILLASEMELALLLLLLLLLVPLLRRCCGAGRMPEMRRHASPTLLRRQAKRMQSIV